MSRSALGSFRRRPKASTAGSAVWVPGAPYVVVSKRLPRSQAMKKSDLGISAASECEVPRAKVLPGETLKVFLRRSMMLLFSVVLMMVFDVVLVYTPLLLLTLLERTMSKPLFSPSWEA